MTIFRWVVGSIALLFAAGSLGAFLVFLLADVEVWLRRARTLRRGLTLALLLWFNVEVWGRVVWTLVRW